jgi:CheY-like chemotaxis protein
MKNPRFTILVAEDDANDRLLLQRAIEAVAVSAELRLVTCGEEAIAYLKGEGPFEDRAQHQYPSILITDLKMPRGDGFSILAFIRSRPQSAIILTVVLSASSDLDDVKKAYQMGATAFVIKPLENVELARTMRVLVDFWMLCEVPEADEAGRLLVTESTGKLGERFPE